MIRTAISIITILLVYNIIGTLWMIARLNMKREYALEHWSALHFIAELTLWPVSMPRECYRAIQNRIRRYKNK